MAPIPIWSLIPFLCLLGAIAVLPMLAEPFWSRNRNKLWVSLAASVPAVLYLLPAGFGKELGHSMLFDYVPFIVMLGALFVVTGGIHADTGLHATPAINTGILAAGTILASILGTTGAAMLLVRPLFHVNRLRHQKQHTVLFFIATVCNTGGLLTPLGDPPLFMMHLRGAPFDWFLTLTPEWLFANAAILAIYYAVDRFHWRREPPGHDLGPAHTFSLAIKGGLNFVWLGGIVLAIACLNKNLIPAFRDNPWLGFSREAALLLMAVLSLIFTPRSARTGNGFSWHPLHEVAAIFLGIFATMLPCLLYLEQNARTLGISTPVYFYYASGILSSVLDNTPTAITFHSLAAGLGQSALAMPAGIPENLLRAICVASVFFGAMTYIGNGPNFMVRTLAERHHIPMPGFFAYVYRFALIVLLPVFILTQLIFIRHST